MSGCRNGAGAGATGLNLGGLDVAGDGGLEPFSGLVMWLVLRLLAPAGERVGKR